MALITVRNTDTGEILQLSEDWLERFPEDPYQRVPEEELAKLPPAPYGVIELPESSEQAAEQPAEEPKKAPAEQPPAEPAPRGRF